jgi:hypothetical protein
MGIGNEDRHEQHRARSMGVVAKGLVRSLVQRTAVRERGFVADRRDVLGGRDIPFPIAVQKHGGA